VPGTASYTTQFRALGVPSHQVDVQAWQYRHPDTENAYSTRYDMTEHPSMSSGQGRLLENPTSFTCGIFYFNNSSKFEQKDLLQSTEGVSLVDTWIVSSLIRFTNIPIYNLAATSGSIRLSYRTSPPTLINQSHHF
jgi:hypothetical protein